MRGRLVIFYTWFSACIKILCLQLFRFLTQLSPELSEWRTKDALSPLKFILKWLILAEGKRTISPHRSSSLIPGSRKQISPPSQSSSDIAMTMQSFLSFMSRWTLVETLKLTTKPLNGYTGEKPSPGRMSAYCPKISHSSGRISLS